MKKIIINILAITLLICSLNINTVYASEQVEQDIVKVTGTVLQGYENLLKYAGILIDTGIANTRSSLQFVKEQLVKLGFFQNTPTDQEVQEFFDDNITVSPHSQSHHDSDITYDQNVNIYIKNEIEEIIANSGYRYVYSLNFYPYYSQFGSPDQYNKLKNLIGDNKRKFCLYAPNSGTCVIIDNESDLGFYHSNTYSNDIELCYSARYSTWQSLNIGDGVWYGWNGQNNEWEEKSAVNNNQQQYAFVFQDDATIQDFNVNFGYWFVISGSDTKQYIEYSDFSTLQASSVGMQPYYITDSYNNFNNTTGSYNTTTTDNSVTYSDVGNIVNNYYNDNGKYPTPDEIKIQIEIIQSGGGSGGGGSGGGSDSDLGIFDFLSRIGQVLGNLIKNLGNVLAELVEGISTTIQALFESIPTVFSDFLGGVLGWLPSELRALITLAISAMVIVGLIKMFRS